jgi:hypothetical protein
MTELTPRQILDAIKRGLEETARQFRGGGSAQMQRRPPPSEPTNDLPDSETRPTPSSEDASSGNVTSSHRSNTCTAAIAASTAMGGRA